MWIGVAMVVFPLFYAVIENDVRRILAYSLVNQLGFMVTAIGIGTPLAINGAVAHAFCHILYTKVCLDVYGLSPIQDWKTKCTELGGLYKSMPLTFAFFVIGALSMSFPLTNGYVSKSDHHVIGFVFFEYYVWFVLLFAAGVYSMWLGSKFPSLPFSLRRVAH